MVIHSFFPTFVHSASHLTFLAQAGCQMRADAFPTPPAHICHTLKTLPENPNSIYYKRLG